jgi:hypothetical protein
MAIDCGRSIGFAPQGSVTQTWRDNSSVQFQTNNSNTLTATGGLGYRQPALGTLSIFSNYSSTDFPDSTILPPLITQRLGFIYYGGGISYDRHLGGRIEGVGSVSYTALDPNSVVQRSFRGVTYSVDAIYHLNTRATLHFATSRATVPSNRIDAEYSVDQIFEVDAAYDVTTRWNFTLTGQSKTQDYKVTNIGPVDDLTNQYIDDIFASVNYKLTRRLSFGVRVGDEERRANFPGLNYSSTQVGLTAKASY